MRDVTIARNYAEVLLALAQRAGDPAAWGVMMRDVADAVRQDDRLRLFLNTPQVPAETKSDIIAAAFRDRYPQTFVRFLQSLISHRRQALIPEIAAEYVSLLDAVEGRVRADVTVARPLDGASRKRLAEELTRAMGHGRKVVPNVRVDRSVLGGVIVRIGDTVADGSVRARLALLRRRLVASAHR